MAVLVRSVRMHAVNRVYACAIARCDVCTIQKVQYDAHVQASRIETRLKNCVKMWSVVRSCELTRNLVSHVQWDHVG